MSILPFLDVGMKILDKVIPDPEARQKAKLDLMQLQQQGQLKEMEVSMSAIIAEANSQDKWTSRARPSFLYVIYILLLSSIPMGIVYAFSPVLAQNITTGFKAWLGAIPSEIITLFGVGYLGYAGGRSMEKIKGK